MEKIWLVISWQHVDHMDGAYGRRLAEFYGTYEQATDYARIWADEYSPVGVVGVVK